MSAGGEQRRSQRSGSRLVITDEKLLYELQNEALGNNAWRAPWEAGGQGGASKPKAAPTKAAASSRSADTSGGSSKQPPLASGGSKARQQAAVATASTGGTNGHQQQRQQQQQAANSSRRPPLAKPAPAKSAPAAALAASAMGAEANGNGGRPAKRIKATLVSSFMEAVRMTDETDRCVCAGGGGWAWQQWRGQLVACRRPHMQ